MAGVLHMEFVGTQTDASVAWKGGRQFLWEIVHDTRGLLRGRLSSDDIRLVRSVGRPGKGGDPAPELDPDEASAAYRRLRSALQEAAEVAPGFTEVAADGSDEWAAAYHFTHDDEPVVLVGGWGPATLRRLATMEAIDSFEADGPVRIGSVTVRLRNTPFLDVFRVDLDGLDRALGEATRRGVKVRFVVR